MATVGAAAMVANPTAEMGAIVLYAAAGATSAGDCRSQAMGSPTTTEAEGG